MKFTKEQFKMVEKHNKEIQKKWGKKQKEELIKYAEALINVK